MLEDRPTDGDALHSALDGMPTLPGLEPDPEAEAGLKPAQRDTAGIYSGARIAERNPRLYAMVVAMMAEGNSDASIRRVTGMHPETVASIRLREVGSMTHAAYTRVQGARLKAVAVQAVDRLAERLIADSRIAERLAEAERMLDELPRDADAETRTAMVSQVDALRRAQLSARDLAYSLEVAQRNAQVLAGEPTDIRREITSGGSDPALLALLAGSPRMIEASAGPAPYDGAQAIHSRGNSEGSREDATRVGADGGADADREGERAGSDGAE